MCDFCDNISTLDDYKKMYPQDRYDAIVYNHRANKYQLWVEIDDWYYSGIRKKINYCPVCGRKLNDRKRL